METKKILGFNIKDIDLIEMNAGWFKPRANIIGIQSDMDVFREVFFFGDDKDFEVLLRELKKTKQGLDAAKFAGFILTAQKPWSERDQILFDTFFDYKNIHITFKHAVHVLKYHAKRKTLKINRRSKLKCRKTGVVPDVKPVTEMEVFKYDIDLMIGYLENAVKEDVTVFSKIKEWTAQELLESHFFK